MDINSDDTVSDEKVAIKRSGSDVTWIFRNSENEPVEFDMSSIRANTITALLKRSVNLGHSNSPKPRILQGTQTELHLYPDHCDIVFDQNPSLRLVASNEQIPVLIRSLEEAA